MTAAQAKKELREMGLRAVLKKDATVGYEYLVVRISDDRAVACGWSAGNKTDALNDAVESGRSLQAREAV